MLPDGGGDEEKLTHDVAPPTAPVMLDTVSREPEPVASMHERPSDAFLASAESDSGHAEESNGHQTESAASSTTFVSPEAVAPQDSIQSALSPDDTETWEDFIKSGATDPDFVSPALQEFKKSAFRLSSLDEFNGFEVGGFTPNAGEYSFRMDGGAFQRLLALVRCTFVDVSRQGLLTCLVKLSVSRVSLRVQAYDFATFCETTLPLMEAPTDIAHEQPISFVVSFSDLDTAGQAIDGDVAMTYRPEQKRIDLVAGNFERPLIALSAEKFTDFGAEKIGAIDPTSRRPIDPLLLKRAIGYVAPAVKENDIQKCFGILELRGGRAMGGELGAVAIFTAAKLNGLNMHIRRPFIDSVATVLPMLDGEAALFETQKFYIVRDRSTAFGFEKSDASFPKIDSLLAPRPGRDRIVLSRKPFINAMVTLETWLKDSGSLPQFQCSKGGSQVRCIFSAQGENGKKIKISMEGDRRDHVGASVRVFFSPTSLRIAAESCEATYLYFDLYTEQNTAIVSEEGVEEGCDAQTLIGLPRSRKTIRPATPDLKDFD